MKIRPTKQEHETPAGTSTGAVSSLQSVTKVCNRCWGKKEVTHPVATSFIWDCGTHEYSGALKSLHTSGKAP